MYYLHREREGGREGGREGESAHNIVYYQSHLHAGQMLEPTGNLEGKVAYIFHVHQTLGVDVVMANRSDSVS